VHAHTAPGKLLSVWQPLAPPARPQIHLSSCFPVAAGWLLPGPANRTPALGISPGKNTCTRTASSPHAGEKREQQNVGISLQIFPAKYACTRTASSHHTGMKRGQQNVHLTRVQNQEKENSHYFFTFM